MQFLLCLHDYEFFLAIAVVFIFVSNIGAEDLRHYILNVFKSLYILMQNGLDTKVEKSRKQLKERKNRAKKIRGVKKVRKYLFFRVSGSSS